jgi:protein-disulfide isomerase
MASRSQQKKQARADRLAQEQLQATARAQRNRRLRIFGGAIAIAAVIVAVAIAIADPGSSTGPQAPKAAASAVNSLLAGIPQSGNVLGDPKAKVTMTYFGDLQCPYCRAFTLNSLPQFIQTQVKTGKVKMVYRSVCTATCPDGTAAEQKQFDTQQVAAYAAGKQDKFWNYAELFYHEQRKEDSGYVTEAFLAGLASQIHGLNQSTWLSDRSDPALLARVAADQKLAKAYDVPSTPAVIMQGPKDIEPVAPQSVPTYDQLVAAVRDVS